MVQRQKLSRIYVISALLSTVGFAPVAAFAQLLTAACHTPAAMELYASENFDSFPCDLSQLKDPPRIWVIGETHKYVLKDPKISADEKARIEKIVQFWTGVEDLARNRVLFNVNEGEQVAMDGKPIDVGFYSRIIQDDFVILPIEDSFAYTINQFVIIQIELQRKMFRLMGVPDEQKAAVLEELRFYASWMVKAIWYSPYVKQAWKSVQRPITNRNEEKFGKMLDQLECDPNGFEKIDAATMQLTQDELLDLVGLIDKTAQQFAILLKTVKIHQLSLPLDRMSAIMGKVNSSELFGAGSGWQSEIIASGSPAREATMAANTAKAYCANIQLGKNLPIVMRVGQLHVTPILNHLKAMAAKSKLSPDLIRTKEPTF